MMHSDLTNYTDGFGPPLSNVFSVGWLGGELDFPVGESAAKHIGILKKLAFETNPFSACFDVARGFSSCGICGGINTTLWRGEKKIIGAFSMLIPSVVAGQYFVAPSAIIHFMEKHHYCPPEVFLSSLEQVNLEREFSADKVMQSMIGF